DHGGRGQGSSRRAKELEYGASDRLLRLERYACRRIGNGHDVAPGLFLGKTLPVGPKTVITRQQHPGALFNDGRPRLEMNMARLSRAAILEPRPISKI